MSPGSPSAIEKREGIGKGDWKEVISGIERKLRK